VEPYNIFSDCFAAMAFGQLYKTTGNDEFAGIAQNTFENILKRSENPKGKYSKLVSGTRPLKGFSLPMILCNLSLKIDRLGKPRSRYGHAGHSGSFVRNSSIDYVESKICR
jgi:N-acylglucosamine 2-epimerase